uniref:Uncharacterized protein n=1 Tax=Plectus sambesii TaxID=2011161 RepID=A0A914X7Q2_9BILA
MTKELRLIFVFALASLAIEYGQAKELKELMLSLRQKRQGCGPACGPAGCCGVVCCAPPPPPCCAPPPPPPPPCCVPPPPPPPPCCAPPPLPVCPPPCQPACVPACVATCATGGCGRKRREALRAERNLLASGEAQTAEPSTSDEDTDDVTKTDANDWGYNGAYGTVGGAYGTNSGYGGNYGNGYGSGGYGGGYGGNNGYGGPAMGCRQC